MELNEESEKLFQEFYEKNIDELCQLSQKSPEEICEYIKNLTDLDLLREREIA